MEWKLLVTWKYAFLLLKPVGASRISNADNSVNCVWIEKIMDSILSYIVLRQYTITLENKCFLKPTPKITIRKALVIYFFKFHVDCGKPYQQNFDPWAEKIFWALTDNFS